MSAKLLRAESLGRWVEALHGANLRVVGPVRAGEATLYSVIRQASDLALERGLPRKSAKGVVFPQTEVLLRFHHEDGTFRVVEVSDLAPPTVLLGVHPCDAAAMEVMDAVFGWDYQDKFYLERRAMTTVVTLGCDRLLDDSCFCTSVGLAPDSRRGSDVFAARRASGDLALEPVTEKGETLLARTPALFEDTDSLPTERRLREGDQLFDRDRIRAWLTEHFEDELWQRATLRCVGCGTCTYLCPVCHCFDIVDETRHGEGVRRRNWDSCQFGLFTQHASGHNPRPNQAARQRQRVMHKFKHYVEKFGETLCVGCGRCVRSCPAGQSLIDVLCEIDRLAAAETGTQRVRP